MSNIVDTVAASLGIPKSKAAEITKSVTEAIAVELGKGESVVLNGLGRFSIKNTPERTGRNPRTGEALAIAAGKKVSFSASSVLKARLK